MDRQTDMPTNRQDEKTGQTDRLTDRQQADRQISKQACRYV